MGIEIQLDPVTGDLLVPADLYHQARISLASQGLPEFSGVVLILLIICPSVFLDRLKGEIATQKQSYQNLLQR